MPASASLRRLFALRVRVKLRLDALQRAPLRYNVVEGHASFALMATDASRIVATVMGPDGRWRGLETSPLPLRDGRWHEVELDHDGTSRARLLFDGATVAARTDVLGPVGPVGPHGVAIGRWPDRPIYLFRGWIGELQLWRYDPSASARRLLDDCCELDMAEIDAVLGELRERGVSWSDLVAAMYDVVADSSRMLGIARQSPAAPALGARLRGLASAVRARDRDELMRAAGLAADEAAGAIPGGERRAFDARLKSIGERLGITAGLAQRLARAVCADFLLGDSGAGAAADPPRDEPWDDRPAAYTPPDEEPSRDPDGDSEKETDPDA